MSSENTRRCHIAGRTGSDPLVRRIISLFTPYRMRVSLVVLTIVATSTLGIVNPLLTKVAFDQALFPSHGPPNPHLLYELVLLMAAVAVATGGLLVAEGYLVSVLGQRVMHDLRSRIFDHLQKMSLRFFTERPGGELQSHLTNDVAGVERAVTETLSSATSNVIVVASTAIAMVLLSWPLTVLAVIAIQDRAGLRRWKSRSNDATRDRDRWATEPADYAFTSGRCELGGS